MKAASPGARTFSTQRPASTCRSPDSSRRRDRSDTSSFQLTWCSAQPSGRVTRDAYERISALLLEDLRVHGAVDAVYLDLHGAMVAEHVDDADGEILRRVRDAVGPDVPVVASLDFHANLSRQMACAATALVS